MGVGARERNFPAYETRLVIQHNREKLMQHRSSVDIEHKIIKRHISIDLDLNEGERGWKH